MKMKLTLLLFSMVASFAFAAETPPEHLSVAVYDFKGDVAAGDYGTKVTALVTADLATNPNIVMLERAQLNKALSEQAFGASGMVSSDAAAKIGQITGVKVLVSGQVIMIKQDHLVIIANLIGTETGRLFAAKVDGPADNLMELASSLSSKIAEAIKAHGSELVAEAEESHTQRLNRIAESIKGTNRPSVSVSIQFFNETGGHWKNDYAEFEFGVVLLRTGFTLIDNESDRKADIEITGDSSVSSETPRGDLVSTHTAIEIKVQERRTGKIIAIDRQESAATGIGRNVSARESHVRAVDELAARILPLLAK
jgi:TolB-like protein